MIKTLTLSVSFLLLATSLSTQPSSAQQAKDTANCMVELFQGSNMVSNSYSTWL